MSLQVVLHTSCTYRAITGLRVITDVTRISKNIF